MKKLLVLLFAAILACSLTFAQDTASGEKKRVEKTGAKDQTKSKKGKQKQSKSTSQKKKGAEQKKAQ